MLKTDTSRFSRGAMITAIALLASTPAHAQNEELSLPMVDGVERRIEGVGFPPIEESAGTPDRSIWSYRLDQAGGRQLQLELTDISVPADADFRIEIRDAAGQVVDELTRERLAGRSSYLTNAAFGPTIRLDVFGPNAGGLNFNVSSVFFFRSGFEIESIIGDPQLEHLAVYDGDHATVVGQVRGAVAKLTFLKLKNGKRRRFTCTGFMIASDLMVTNEHCVNTPAVCGTATAQFGYALTAFGNTPPVDQYRCKEVVTTSVKHDLAMLQLEKPAGERWGTLRFAAADPAMDDRLFIIQHPNGEPKQISDIDCKVVGIPAPGRAPNVDLAHACDTLGGSSGSPVFNIAGEVIGLHHWGRSRSGTYKNANRAVRGTEVRSALPPDVR